MDQKFLRSWVWIVFLLPFLVYAGQNQKNSGGSEAAIQGNLREENVISIPRDESLTGWLTDLTENIAFEYGLSPKLVKSIILTESNGNPQKISSKGAKGLMQLMPVIAKEYKVLDPLDPVANIRGGVQYFRNLLEEFSGDLYLALAAYNAGPAAVRKYRGIPPFRETQEFVRRVSDIFQSGEESPHLSPTTLKVDKGRSVDQETVLLTISASPRSLGLFLKKMDPGPGKVQNQ